MTHHRLKETHNQHMKDGLQVVVPRPDSTPDISAFSLLSSESNGKAHVRYISRKHFPEKVPAFLHSDGVHIPACTISVCTRGHVGAFPIEYLKTMAHADQSVSVISRRSQGLREIAYTLSNLRSETHNRPLEHVNSISK